MEEKTIQTLHRKSRHTRRKARNKWIISGAILVLSLSIILIGLSKTLPSKATPLKATPPKTPSPKAAAPTPTAADTPFVATLEDIFPEDQKNMDSDNADLNIADTDSLWYLTLVNKKHPVPQNYEVNLVQIEGGEQVDERIYEPLMEMLEAAKEGNLDQLPFVVSGYRTQEQQQRLYDDKLAQYRGQGYSENEARTMTEQWVAIPGYSEHQLGLAVDINGATYDVYLWLQENSYKYGFIFRYPGSKTEITGTAEEVWHYRYVGVEAAAKIHEQGICLEEYLENPDNR